MQVGVAGGARGGVLVVFRWFESEWVGHCGVFD